MKIKSKLTLLFTFCTMAFAFAQTQVSGIITGADGQPIPGAAVLVQGTSNGTTSDFDGNYTITVEENQSIEFTYLGYLAQVIVYTGQDSLNVSLEEDLNELDEIVVTGYGSRKKSDLTGAVASVKSEELNAFPLLNAAQALQGRAAGVVVQSNNGGEPGAPISIKVRGNTSISASSAPLIVVDGFVGATMPQPGDIESIEVLKDASATAIYGSRGSGGVVLVTTKKGKTGSLNVEVNTNYSTQTTANKLDLMNADQFATYTQSYNPGYVQGSEETDWQDLIYQSGSTTNHQASFSGGTDKINFYASANYFNQDGIIVNSDFERITFLTNVDAQINDKLKLGMNLFGSRGVKNGILTQSTGDTANGGGDDVVGLAFRFSPDSGIYNADGSFTQSNVGDGIENPFAVANELTNETIKDEFRFNAYASYEILENLTFKATIGHSSRNETLGRFKPQTFVLSEGYAQLDNWRRTSLLSENYLTYSSELGKGSLTVLAGYSYQKSDMMYLGARTEQLLSDDLSFYNLGAGQLQTRRVYSNFNESEIQSQFGRINYDYNNKYLLTATIRRDGSSKFAENEKYSVFPSGAIGWKISNEEFLKDNETISNLKLRASYGVTGNQAISAYQSLQQIALVSATAVDLDPSFSLSQEANPDLKWESSYQTNIGVDLGLLNGMVSISVDYYNIDTKDLLLETTSNPIYLGASNLQSFGNVGEINNSGFEVSIDSRNISKDNFSWTTNFNLSANENKVVTLNDGADIIGSAAPAYFAGKDTYILSEGQAVGLFWGMDYQGIYQGGTAPDGTGFVGTFNAPGDPLFTDVDGNGSIDSNDLMIIGDPNPDFTWGLTNNLSYKNWDLNIFFQGAQGGEILNLTNVQLFNGDSNSVVAALDAWTPTNTDATIPRNVASRGREISTRFIEDGSYIRLKNIAVGYNFPSSVIEKLNVDNLRLSLSAQNLLTITSYSGLDPEVSYFGSGGVNNQKRNVAQGHDFGNYPTLRSFNLSLNLKF
ncbi:MAG: TonB-dependent receptor [Wenyingzhuangia sp.]|uniref:SusC/RagA family TonB-linked outer membrane protein n=1 Tax=Wenyingzhuangia sp. TaxID=1964193 RepID=UPI00321B3521